MVTAERPLSRQEEKAQDLKDTVEQAVETLAEQLAAGHSERFIELMKFYSRFWTYSWANQILILSQRPNAVRMAGMKTWNRQGYTIRKGERATWIWAPILVKKVDEETGLEEEVLLGFRPAPVWDFLQTNEHETKPLPSLWQPLPDDVPHLCEQVVRSLDSEGVEVIEQQLPRGIQGACRQGRIFIQAGLDTRNRLYILCHEWAHHLAHLGETQDEKERDQKELEAEAASFVIAEALGLQHVTAADYMLSYRATPETLKASLGTIQRIVRHILRALDTERQSNKAAA